MSRPAQFTGSLSSLRYASTIVKEDIVKLGVPDVDAEVFVDMVQQAARRKEQLPHVNWSDYRPVDIESLPQYDKLPTVSDEDKCDILSRFAVVKLNGGVGATMGLKTPKCCLRIKDNESFLSAVVKSVASLNATFHGLSVPLVFMNSFATQDATLKELADIESVPPVQVKHFMQRRFPRLSPSTLRPVTGDDAWYPPGHGDLFEIIVRSGVAEELIASGQTYAFVSNIDNPGADLDPVIAMDVIRSNARFVFEFTPRTPNDRSGGVLVQAPAGMECLELSQVPDNVLQFGSLDYNAFNTNNLWIHLPTVVELVRARHLRMSVSVVLREAAGIDVLQLEHAMASVYGLPVSSVRRLAVPRKRWRVIKTTADLLMVRAPRLLRLHKGRLVVDEARRIPGLPSIKWGSHFRSVKDMESRIPFPPDIVELVHLTVEGDVRFGRNVKLAGTVILVAGNGESLVIPDGAILRDNIVIGALTMTPH